ncbi:hypothetical protein C8D92_103267 [Tamilnaduibacter salinus]|uniref:Endonuclease n=1 Tax=Tamilnaduibacter salinus TaxID=1484056 RepID=A0A2U1CYX8_9GAMM|nr:endonuclease [Tamilnaduibacter salinus]PVY77580.1 hypothetical protein C8D92_103267 [Tamilnaduibacter salinus]
MPKANRYSRLIEAVFFDYYQKGDTEVAFEREDLERAAEQLNVSLPKNLGDAVYSFRYRNPLPEKILDLQPPGMEWIIEGAGRSKYLFRLVKINRICPNPSLVAIKIPDSTPEIVNAYALSDEQALLAKVRYNRLIDLFIGANAYSLQNHLRTAVIGTGQVEIDEIYVAVDRHGRQFVLPVQAKGGSDQLSVVQSKQDIDCCAEKYPNLICRAISAQFMEDDLIALFEITVDDQEIKVVDERHYRLVPSDAIDADDLQTYASRAP